MTWFIRTREIADADGAGKGTYRLTAWSDEDGGGPFGLCDHEHSTAAEANACPEARERSECY